MGKFTRALLSALLVAGGLVVGCSEFPTAYDRIDDDKVRLLDFVYSPAEAAPGDSVRLQAVFSGKSIDTADIDWRVSYTVVANLYGFDTAYDYQPLPGKPKVGAFSAQTDCFELSLPVPSDIMINSPMIPEDWTAVLPNGMAAAVDPGLRGLSKRQLLDALDAMSARVPVWAAVLSENPQAADSLAVADSLYAQYRVVEPYLPMLLQALAVKVRVQAVVKGSHTIWSDYVVRYNSRFAMMPQTPVAVNRLPVIDSIGVFAVHARALMVFDTVKYSYDFIRLDSPSADTTSGEEPFTTVPIREDYTYYLVAFTSAVDTSQTIEDALEGSRGHAEQHRAMWYFALDESETGGVAVKDYLTVFNDGSLIAQLLPPADQRISTFTVWCEVSDYLLNELYRPQGSCLEEVRVKLAYAD